jgi:long-chain acyl-CoA synthetase
MNIGSLFSRHARYRPNHLAFVFEDQRLTWLELNQGINRLANALLALGIEKGDKVATILQTAWSFMKHYGRWPKSVPWWCH